MVHNFKVGDAVKLINVKPGWCAEVGDTGKIITLYDRRFDGEPAYIVELDKSPGSRIPYSSRRLELLDDPLPPVPDSVMYNAGQGCRLEVATLPPNANYEARVRIGVFSNTLVYQGKCTCLEPDEALQLAHDLRRMAMEIKRKQKREDTI